MGRKKKIIKEEPKKEQKTTSTDSISYQGTVTVSLQKGKKTISKKTYHNTGCKNIFKFLCYAISGTYVSESRPCKIVLFNNAGESTPGGQSAFKHNQIISPAILTDTTAVVDPDSQKSVTLHFRIHYGYINGNGTKIYKAALYNAAADISTDPNVANNIYAFYQFKDDMGNWNPIEIPTSSGNYNYSLIIEWTMTFDNNSAA